MSSVSGALVLELDGRPALDVLREDARDLGGQPLVVALLTRAALPHGESDAGDAVLSAIRGVDPTRRALAFADPVAPGDEVSFAVIDPETARTNLDELARQLAAKTAGALPSFGVLLSCAGRRSSFYGGAGVEPRIIRQRLGGVPLVGMHSSFQLGPGREGVAVHAYSTAVGLLSVPS